MGRILPFKKKKYIIISSYWSIPAVRKWILRNSLHFHCTQINIGICVSRVQNIEIEIYWEYILILAFDTHKHVVWYNNRNKCYVWFSKFGFSTFTCRRSTCLSDLFSRDTLGRLHANFAYFHCREQWEKKKKEKENVIRSMGE